MARPRAVPGLGQVIALLELAEPPSEPGNPTIHRRPADIFDRLIETDHAQPSGNVPVAPNHQAVNTLRTKDTNVV